MDIDITKSERGYIRAMARELLVNGRVNNVPDAIQMAEELINETTYTYEGTKNELERNRSK
jgi:hypothetical protein